jgi:hypothetical protein
MYVRPHGTTRASNECIFIKLEMSVFFFKYVGKIQDSLECDKNTGHLNEDPFTFMILSDLVLITMIQVPHKYCVEKIKTHVFKFIFLIELCVR